MFKRVMSITCVLLFFCLVTLAVSAEVKVMRGIDLMEAGEDCRLITETSAWKITPENAKETYSKAVTLKQMIRDGWKIAYVKDLPSRYSTEFLFVFIKD